MTARANPAQAYLGSLAPSGRRTQRQALALVASIVRGREVKRPELFAWQRIGPEQTSRVQAFLASHYQPSTANKVLAALRRVLKEAWRLGLLTFDEYQRAADVPRVRGRSVLRGRALDPAEVRALFEACGSGASGLRNAAALVCCYGAGCRRAEAVALDLEHVNLATGRLRVEGKGRAVRILPTGDGVAMLRAWVAVRGEEPGPFLTRVTADGPTLQRLSGAAVWEILRKLAKQAGIEQCGPHDLRRTFASSLSGAGVDVATIAELLGHRKLETTQRYLRHSEDLLAASQRRLFIPSPSAGAR